MTKDEFQRQTHDFMSRDEAEAQAMAARANELGIEGDSAVAVRFGEHWCVMLQSAARFAIDIGVDGKIA